MKHRSLLLAVSLILVASIALLAACSPGSSPTPQPQETATKAPPTEQPAAKDKDEVVELTYFYRITTPAQENYLKWIIDGFNKKFEGKIHVTGNGVDDETYKTKMAIELRSPNPPDIFFSWEGGRAKALIDAGYSAPLNEYYDKFGWDEILNPAGVSLSVYDGKKYFVPWEMAAAVFWYRPDIYEKYGLSIPKTWDEFLANAEVLKENDIAPLLLVNQKRWPAQFLWTALLVNKYGLDVYQQLLNNEIPWTDERVVDAFAALQDMVDRDIFYPGVNSIDLAPGVVPFAQGKVGAWYQGTWMVSFFKGDAEEIPFPVDFFLFPQIGDRTPIMEVFAENTIMMHAQSKNKDAAAEFINYHISTPVQQAKLEMDRPFPANVKIDTTKMSPLEQKLATAMAEAGDFTFMHVDHAFEPAIANTFLDATQALVGGAMTPEEAAKATEAEAVKVRGEVK